MNGRATGDDPRYGAEVRRRMASLPGVGTLDAAADVAIGRAGAREQGCEVELYCRIVGHRVTEARFRAFGCPHLLAAASWLTERLAGAARVELAAWDWREAAAALEVPAAKFGRLLTLQDAVRHLARNWPGDPPSTV
jgi:NifU-like protein involved in Fe-S cluster formation